MRRSIQIQTFVLLLLLLIVFGIWYAVWREDRRGMLTVSFLDVGQGDAIFIDAPSGRQILIDGGRDRSVLRQLARVMPWWDRTVDIVVATHPDLDHINGLIDVLARYRVGTIIHSSVEGDTATFDTFNQAMENEKAHEIVAMRGQVVDIGKGIFLEILFPDRLVSSVDTNDGSIIARLVYRNTSFMLTGDAPSKIENYLVQLDSDGLNSDVLKAGHHGSKTSSSELFLGFVNPEYAVYSRGCDNSYGHPHQDIVARFARFEIPTLDTCEEGTITFVSDGQVVRGK